MGATGFPWPRYWAVLIVILVLSLTPLASVAIVMAVANAYDCQLNEAFINPCIVMGVDLGAPLTYMGISGWLMLISLPFGAVALPVWLVTLLIHFWVHRSRASGPGKSKKEAVR